MQKRGKCIYVIGFVYNIFVCITIFIVYIASYFVKRKMLKNKSLTPYVALNLDSLTFVTYFFFWATLTGAAIYFKVLERRYSMQIMKLQLFAAILLGFTAIISGAC